MYIIYFQFYFSTEFGIQLESVNKDTRVWCKNENDDREEFKIKLISTLEGIEELAVTTSLPIVEIENGPGQE